MTRKKRRKKRKKGPQGKGQDKYNKQHIPLRIAERMLQLRLELELLPHWERQPLLDKIERLHEEAKNAKP